MFFKKLLSIDEPFSFEINNLINNNNNKSSEKCDKNVSNHFNSYVF